MIIVGTTIEVINIAPPRSWPNARLAFGLSSLAAAAIAEKMSGAPFPIK